MTVEEVLRDMRDETKPIYRMQLADAIEAEVGQLKALLQEARDDIAEDVTNRYPHRDYYPRDQRKYEQDMDIVRRIDAALTGEDKS